MWQFEKNMCFLESIGYNTITRAKVRAWEITSHLILGNHVYELTSL